VRDHIHDCFEAVGAFLLPHPGFDVIAKDFDGDIEKIRQPFRTLLQVRPHAPLNPQRSSPSLSSLQRRTATAAVKRRRGGQRDA
jgi:hypothetical protein